MSFYIFSIFYSYFVSFTSRYYTKFIFPLLVLPLVLFSAFRGVSGKDTSTYIARFFNSSLFSNGFSLDSEPVITSIIEFSRFFDRGDPFYFFLFHAVIVTTCFYFIARNFEKSKFYLLTVGVVFLIDGITNGMRITLAYHFFVLALVSNKRMIFYSLAVFSQLTIVFSIFLEYMLRKWSELSILRRLVFVFLLSIFMVLLFILKDHVLFYLPRVDSKIEVYSGMTLSTRYSGIADIYIMFGLLLLASLYNRSSFKRFLLDLPIIMAFCAITFMSTSLSLAFIRVFKLLIIALCFSPLLLNPKRKIPTWLVFLLGIPYTLNFIRQVITNDGFLPYGDF
ncbi:EpsG family protein [Vibrio vulnificus]